MWSPIKVFDGARPMPKYIFANVPEQLNTQINIDKWQVAKLNNRFHFISLEHFLLQFYSRNKTFSDKRNWDQTPDDLTQTVWPKNIQTDFLLMLCLLGQHAHAKLNKIRPGVSAGAPMFYLEKEIMSQGGNKQGIAITNAYSKRYSFGPSRRVMKSWWSSWEQ